jgi:predicted transcriptional regulator
MGRTTISLPPELHKRLRLLAAERGISMASLILEAVAGKAFAQRPKALSLGIGASGHSDTARRASDERPEPPTWR